MNIPNTAATYQPFHVEVFYNNYLAFVYQLIAEFVQEILAGIRYSIVNLSYKFYESFSCLTPLSFTGKLLLFYASILFVTL